MSEDSPIHDLAETEEVRDLIHRSVAVIARGGRVGVLNPEGQLRVLASAVSHEACVLDGADSGPTEFSIPLPHAESLRDWIADSDRLSMRIARKCWPGSVRFSYPFGSHSALFDRLPQWTRRLAMEQGRWTLDCPAVDSIREMIPLSPGPIIQFTKRLDPIETTDHHLVNVRLSDLGLDLILIDSTRHSSIVPANVLIRDGRAEILDHGDISDDQMRWLMGIRILFVCTGNTCRSPMAEALCKVVLAESLGCEIDALDEFGVNVLSAGVSAGRNQPAAPESIAALGEMGKLLQSHCSRMICEDLLRTADLIYAMTQSHRDVLLMEFPEMADRVELLDPDAYDIPDPYGQSLEVYRMTAESIREALRLRRASWTFLPSGGLGPSES